MHDASYEDIAEKLRIRYGSREQQEKFRTGLKFRRRKPGESLQELAQDVERITVLAYPAADAPMRDVLGKDAFIDSLNSPGLECNVREREPSTFGAAVTTAMKLEVLHKSLEFNKESQRTKFAKGAQVDTVVAASGNRTETREQATFNVQATAKDQVALRHTNRNLRGLHPQHLSVVRALWSSRLHSLRHPLMPQVQAF